MAEHSLVCCHQNDYWIGRCSNFISTPSLDGLVLSRLHVHLYLPFALYEKKKATKTRDPLLFLILSLCPMSLVRSSSSPGSDALSMSLFLLFLLSFFTFSFFFLHFLSFPLVIPSFTHPRLSLIFNSHQPLSFLLGHQQQRSSAKLVRPPPP